MNVIVPNGFDSWNPAMRGAYKMGYSAKVAGTPKTACPYADNRKPSGGLTWSRAFRACWFDGYYDAEKVVELERK
jgi:ribosome modulation factor